MDLTQIRYFLALAETLNFTRAAEACHVTQPALTKSIQKLEDELGGPLLLRERANSQLTELGRTMLPLLRRTFEAADVARQGAMHFHRQELARLRIGMHPDVAPDALVPLLREVTARFPGLEVTLRQGGGATLNAWLLVAEVDVALTTEVPALTPRAHAWRLFDDEVVVILDSEDPQAAAGSVPAEWLATAARVGCADEAAGHAGAHAGATTEQVWTMIRAGLGVGLSTARRAVPPGLVQRPLHPPRAVATHLAAVPGRPLNRVADALVKLARARDWSLAEA